MKTEDDNDGDPLWTSITWGLYFGILFYLAYIIGS